MSETFTYIGRRFTKGLREAPHEFVATCPRGTRSQGFIQFVSRHLGSAMDEARKNADRDSAK